MVGSEINLRREMTESAPRVVKTIIQGDNGRTIPTRNLPIGILSIPATIEVGTINPGIKRTTDIAKKENVVILFLAFSMASGLITS